jgi:hypothetical protein
MAKAGVAIKARKRMGSMRMTQFLYAAAKYYTCRPSNSRPFLGMLTAKKILKGEWDGHAR